MPDRSPGYDLDDELHLDDAAQYRALFEPTRMEIVRLVGQRAATVSQLAEALDRPKGTIGHHVDALADAGLVRVVRTERVRAIEAKYWGRTARTFVYGGFDGAGIAVPSPVATAAEDEDREIDTVAGDEKHDPFVAGVGHREPHLQPTLILVLHPDRQRHAAPGGELDRVAQEIDEGDPEEGRVAVGRAPDPVLAELQGHLPRLHLGLDDLDRGLPVQLAVPQDPRQEHAGSGASGIRAMADRHGRQRRCPAELSGQLSLVGHPA